MIPYRMSVTCLKLDISVGLSAGIQSAGDLVFETLVRILHSVEKATLALFDSKIVRLCQNIEINNNTYVCYTDQRYSLLLPSEAISGG